MMLSIFIPLSNVTRWLLILAKHPPLFLWARSDGVVSQTEPLISEVTHNPEMIRTAD